MTKKVSAQPELQMGAPAPAAETVEAEVLELIDDVPDKVSSDLRKFNKARAAVSKAVAPLKKITIINTAAEAESALAFMKVANGVKNLIEDKRVDLVTPYNAEVKRINNYAKDLSIELPTQITRVKQLVLDHQSREAIRMQKEQTEARHKQLLAMALIRYDKGTPERLADHYYDDIGKGFIWRADLENVSGPVWEALLQGILNKREEARTAAIDQLKQQREGHEFFGDDAAVAAIDEQIGSVMAVPASKPVASYGGSFAPAKVNGTTRTWTFETTDLSQVPREYLMLDETKVRRAITGGTREIAGLRVFQKTGLSLR